MHLCLWCAPFLTTVSISGPLSRIRGVLETGPEVLTVVKNEAHQFLNRGARGDVDKGEQNN